jgi:phage terminase large subunit GpA-like protein
MDEVNEPSIETIVLMASSQIGKTETLLNITGYFMHQDPCPILLIEPTLEIAESYSKDRLAPMVRDTPVLRELIPEPRTRDGGNTLLHKQFRGGHVTLVGANSPSGLASRPIRIILADEISRYLPSAGTEGNPLRLADRRASTFWNRKKIYTSSPGIAGICNVTREFEDSDKQYFQVPCYRCGRGQVLEFKQIMWDAGRPETAHYVCRHCSATWNDAQRIEAIFSAEDAGFGWIATAEFRGIAGHSIWAAYSPWMTFAEIAKTFLAAKHADDSGDPEPLKTWTNTIEGRAWVEKGQRANPEPLVERLENYSAESLPWQVLYLTAAVDTQDDRLEIKIMGWRAANRIDPPEAWTILHKIVYGDPAKQPVWDEIDIFLLREYRTQDGRALRVSVACVDSGGHHAEAVYRYCNKRLGRRVYAVKGAAGAKPIWPARISKSKKFENTKVFIIGVDTAKDAIYARLKISEPGPGYLHFPVTSEASGTFDLKYFQQLTCEYVKTKFLKGHAIREWHKPVGARNEALDLLVYNLAALHARRIPWEILARTAPSEPPERPPEGDDKPPSNTPPASRPPPQRVPPVGNAIRPVRIRIR